MRLNEEYSAHYNCTSKDNTSKISDSLIIDTY